MKLYSYWRSSSSWRVRIALNVKELKHEIVPVHLLHDGGQQRSANFTRLNPLKEVPALELEEGGQPAVLTQSMAIIEYLEEAYPMPALLPQPPMLRAKVRQLAEMINSGTQPLQNLVILQAIEQLGGSKEAWAKQWIARGLTAVEAVAQGTAGRFLVGDSVTLADLFLVPQLYGARRFNVDLAAYPRLTQVEAALNALPAFAAAHADKQVDANS